MRNTPSLPNRNQAIKYETTEYCCYKNHKKVQHNSGWVLGWGERVAEVKILHMSYNGFIFILIFQKLY